MEWVKSSKFGVEAFQRGRYDQAERHLTDALTAAKKLGPDGSVLARAYNDLASVLHALGRLREAEPLYRKALSIDERDGDSDPVNAAVTLENLAELYNTQYRNSEAAAMYRRAQALNDARYEKMAKSLGSSHPDLVPQLRTLAALAEAQNKLDDAEEFYRQMLAIQESQADAPETELAGILGQLGYICTLQSKFSEAESLYTRAHDIEKRVLDPDHPDAAETLIGLATLYHRQGRDTKAEMFGRRALASLETAYGPNHHETTGALKNLALQFAALKRYADAEPLLKRMLDIGEKILGPDHPHLVTDLIDIAGLYCDQKQYEKAEPLLRRAMKIAVKTSTTTDLSVVNLMELYAWLLDKLGRTAAATEFSSRAAALRAKVA